MSYLASKIEYKNFRPEKELNEIVSNVVRKMEFESPSDSTIRVTLIKTKSYYKGTIRIYSSTGVFVSRDQSPRPEELIAKLEKSMKQKIISWKRNRFINLSEAV